MARIKVDILSQIQNLVAPAKSVKLLDWQLLERFTTQNDQTAFAALVRRHGPMVLCVCRRVLHNEDDAEDAFQATFLVLARKAAAIGKREALAGWLHKVAFRVALRARADAAQRQSRERKASGRRVEDPLAAITGRELLLVLDEELQSLPNQSRAPLVLCYLEEHTRDEAARLLGLSVRTLKRRLERGRETLRRRLERRGLALPAAFLAAGTFQTTTQAVVPGVLAGATVKAAMQAAGGEGLATVVSAHTAHLVTGTLKAMGVAKAVTLGGLALVVALVGTGIGLVAYGGLAPGGGDQTTPGAIRVGASRQSSDNTQRFASDQKPASSSPAQSKAKALEEEMVTIKGRVLAPDGKPVPGADITCVGMVADSLRASGGSWTRRIFGKSKADGEGRFSVQAPPSDKDRFPRAFVFAGGPGYAFACQRLDADERPTEIALRLAAEQALRARLVDLQGQPAAGVEVHVSVIAEPLKGWGISEKTKRQNGFDAGVHLPHDPDEIAWWPKSATTNAQGQFTLHGIPSDWTVTIEIRHNAFAPQELGISPEDRQNGEEVTRALAPARTIEGIVAHADTGKPVPNAFVEVRTQPAANDLNPTHYEESRADEQGRFRVNLPIGEYVAVMAYPPEGTAYLPLSKELHWPKTGVLKQRANLTLPRGILVRGTVMEAPSKPVAGAVVEFEPFPDKNPYYRDDVNIYNGIRPRTRLSGPDGKFEMVVLPGPGHLLINGPTLDYVHTQITTKQLNGSGVGPNRRNYPDALVPLHVKPQAGPHEVTATLRRGVTLTGSVSEPDGKPVQSAVMVCRSYIPYGYDLNATYTKEVRNGYFELPGCDPVGTSEVFFLDVKNRLGAVVKFSGKEILQPVTVRLERCGSATVRLVDEQGKPISKFDTWVEIVLTPGIHGADEDRLKTKGSPPVLADTAHDPAHSRAQTDAEGRITFPCLIPGATYWVSGQHPPRWWLTNLDKEFKVGPGEALDLGEIRVKARK
jgi:RNA polymerase sigma factor (sigma-70 family)